jgi:hypothetical protein
MNEFAERAFSDNGFNQFKLSVDVRNRLTHPKRTQEMIVSRSEREMVQTAEQWLSVHSGNAVLLRVLGKISIKCFQLENKQYSLC